MALIDSSELEKRISELERSVKELQTAVYTHKLVLDSLMNAGEAALNNYRELREELMGRAEQLEDKFKALGMTGKA